MRFAKCGWRRGFTSNKTPQIGSKESQKEGKAKQGKARSLIVQYEKSIEIWYKPDRFPALQPPTSYLLQPIVTQLCYPGISFQVLGLKKLSLLSMFGNNRKYVRILWEKNLRSLHCRIAEIYVSIWMELWVLWNWVTRVARSSSLPFCHRASQHFCCIWKSEIFKLSYIA